MYGTQLSDDDPLVRTFSPSNTDEVFVATSVAHHVSDEEAGRLVHGWGVARDDHDVQAYTRVEV